MDIVICCVEKDVPFLNQLINALSTLRRRNAILVWHRGMVTAGQDIVTTERQRLEKADYVLCLVSSAFLASDLFIYIANRINLMNVIPIILESCDWKASEIGHIQALPRDGRAIRSIKKNWEAWQEIAVEIRELSKKSIDLVVRDERRMPIEYQPAQSVTNSKTLGHQKLIATNGRDIPSEWATNGGFCGCSLHRCNIGDARSHFFDWYRYIVKKWSRKQVDRYGGKGDPGPVLINVKRLASKLNIGIERLKRFDRELELPDVGICIKLVALAWGTQDLDGVRRLMESELIAFRQAAEHPIIGFDSEHWWGPHVWEHAAISSRREIVITDHAACLLDQPSSKHIVEYVAKTPKQVLYLVSNRMRDEGQTLLERIRGVLAQAGGSERAWRARAEAVTKDLWPLSTRFQEVSFYDLGTGWIGLLSGHPDGPGADHVMEPRLLNEYLDKLNNLPLIREFFFSDLSAHDE